MSAQPDLAAAQEALAALFRQFEPLTDKPADVRETVRALVSGNDRLTPEQQAEIYREQFWLRHRDSLYEDFPALAKLLGDEAFERLARAYLAAFPPRSWTLRDLSADLPEFAARQDLPAAARELARYELAFVTLFDAAPQPAVALAKVQAVPADAWSGARLTLSRGLALFRFAHRVHDYRAAVVRDEEPSLAAGAVDLAVWRGADLRVRYAELGAGELDLLEALREAPLGLACERTAERLADPELPARIERWFATWAERGWIADVKAP